MKYGQIAGNKRINEMIYHCFQNICAEDELKFVKNFRVQKPDHNQIMHTFSELIFGAFLCSSDLKLRYDYPLEGKTPDTGILDENGTLCGILELVNFHIDKVTNDNIKSQLKTQVSLATGALFIFNHL